MNTDSVEAIELDSGNDNDSQNGAEDSTMSDAETAQQDSPCEGPGVCLCKAREEQGLNRARVGQQLGLTEKAVKDLEKNFFDRFPNSVYVRGYLKNYAKILGESELEIIEIYDQYCQENELDSGKSTMEPLPEKTGPSNLVKVLFGFAIVCIAIALFAFLGRS